MSLLLPSFLNTVANYCLVAQMIVASHVHARGHPDLLGQNRQMLFGPLGREAAQTLAALIDDAELRQAYAELLEQLERLANHDEDMVNWLAKYLDMPAPKNDKQRRSLDRAVDREIRNAVALVGPFAWVREPEYQKFGTKSIEILVVIQVVEAKIRARLDELEPGLSAKQQGGYKHSGPLVPISWRDGAYIRQLQAWPPLPKPQKR